MKKFFANVDLVKLVGTLEKAAELVIAVIKTARDKNRERDSQAAQVSENNSNE